MRRRRPHLQVSTFPFLAVLLCAMGSLILLLLVLDRRAKVVAVAKAANLLAEAEHKRDEVRLRANEVAEQKRAEIEQARTARLERRRRLEQEQVDLAREWTDAEVKAAEVAAKKAAQADRSREVAALVAQIGEERRRTEQDQAALAAAGQTTQAEGEKARGEASRMAERLALLERALADVKAAREKASQSFSLVPYRGKQGSARRPVYVECTAVAVTLHPGATRLFDPSPERVLAELARRFPDPKEKPYVMLLVRPDGAGMFHNLMMACKGADCELGYEFIDADWVLHFPEDDSNRPAGALDDGPIARRARRDSAWSNAQGAGPRPVHEPPRGRERTSWRRIVAAAAGAGSDRTGRPGSLEAGRRDCWSAQSWLTAWAGTGRGRFTPWAGIDLCCSRPTPWAGGNAHRSRLRPTEWAGYNRLPSRHGAASTSNDATASQNFSPEEGAERTNANAPAGGQQARGPQPVGSTGERADANASGGGLPGLPGEAKPAPRMPRLVGNRDWLVPIECTSDAVVVRSSGQKFSLASLTTPAGKDALLQAVRSLIARRQAGVRPGDPPYRPILRFLVTADGLRAYHTAYPLLEPLGVPLTRQNVEASGEGDRP